MNTKTPSSLIKLTEKLQKAEDTLKAISEGDIDAIVVKGKRGNQIFSRENTQISNILESIDDSFIAFDAEFNYVYLNSKAEKLLGKKSSEVVGKHILQAFQKANGNAIYKLMEKSFTKQKPYKDEYFATKVNKWYQVRLFPSQDGISIYFADITKEKEAENKIRQTEKRFQALIEHSSDAVAIITSTGQNLYCSPSSKNVLGYSAKELLTMNAFSLIHKTDYPFVMNVLKKLLTKKGNTITVAMRVKHKKGDYIWVEVTGTNLIQDPVINGIVINFRDITDRKKAEEEVILLASIVASSDDAIFTKTLEGIITSWNKGAQRLYSYTPKEIIGKKVSILMPDEVKDDFNLIMGKLKKGESVEHYETIRIDKHGKKHDVSITVSPLKNRQGQIMGASTIARDITERREIERRKDDFISLASHELKTPITSMKLFIDMLEQQARKINDEKSQIYVARLKDQTNKLRDLVSDLLDVSRIETGKLRFNQETFNLSQMVEDTVEGLRGVSRKHEIIFSTEGTAMVYADRFRLYQVLTNLVTNACKYSPNGKKVLVQIEKTPTDAVVNVVDFGIGIAEDKKQKIFDKLYQVTDPEEKTYPGLGMGLYISREIVKRHGGKIWVESKKGKGATFSFSLPLAKKKN